MNGAADIRRMLRSPFVIVTGVILAWFIVTFLVWPNANLLLQTFAPGGEPSLRAVEKLASSERAMTSLRNSFLLAFVRSARRRGLAFPSTRRAPRPRHTR